jgi:hypothetical protein
MLEDPDTLEQYAANARAYAERTFDIGGITRQFLEVFAFARRGASPTVASFAAAEDGPEVAS